MSQRKEIHEMMKRPIPKKRVGIVQLKMIREGKCLYGMKRFRKPEAAVEMVKPLLQEADREIVLVMSLSASLEPLAVEIAAVGGLDCCNVDIKSIFKHSLLNNAAYVVCFHNHPSGHVCPSLADQRVTEQIEKAGCILNIPLIDHIIVGEDDFYSFREHGLISWDTCEEVL